MRKIVTRSAAASSIGELPLYGVGRLRCVVNSIPSTLSPAYCLDIGCGVGVWNATLKRIIEDKGYTYIGVDLTKTIGMNRQGDGVYVLGDACALPFGRHFKLVIALEIVEHVNDRKKLLSEIDNLLLEGGHLIISTPNRFSLEGVKGKTMGYITGVEWNAWDPSHRHIFASPEFLSLISQYFFIEDIFGYYLLPNTFKFIDKINSLLITSRQPFNKLCFQIIVLLAKRSRVP